MGVNNDFMDCSALPSEHHGHPPMKMEFTENYGSLWNTGAPNQSNLFKPCQSQFFK